MTESTRAWLDRLMAEVEKGQQLAGHFPDAEALERGRRVATGETSIDDARVEIDAKYSPRRAAGEHAAPLAQSTQSPY
jgi:hypothetical protein